MQYELGKLRWCSVRGSLSLPGQRRRKKDKNYNGWNLRQAQLGTSVCGGTVGEHRFSSQDCGMLFRDRNNVTKGQLTSTPFSMGRCWGTATVDAPIAVAEPQVKTQASENASRDNNAVPRQPWAGMDRW